MNVVPQDLRGIKGQWDHRVFRVKQDVPVQKVTEEIKDQWDHKVFRVFQAQGGLEEILVQLDLPEILVQEAVLGQEVMPARKGFREYKAFVAISVQKAIQVVKAPKAILDHRVQQAQ